MNAETILKALAQHSLQAGLVVVCVLATQWLLRRHLPSRWRFALWWLVLARLLLPFGPASALSLFNYLKPPILAAPPIPATFSQAQTPAVAGAPAAPNVQTAQLVASTPPAPNALTAPPPPNVPAAPPFPTLSTLPTTPSVHHDLLIPALLALWLTGVIVLIAAVFAQLLRFAQKLRRSTHAPSLAASAMLAACQKEFGVTRRIELLETDAISSPTLFGLFRLRLLLPTGLAARFEPSELRYIFLHELAHVRRGDLWLNWLATALQIIHWFNPVIWLGFARMRADRELACDELALHHAGEKTGEAYGATILKLLESLQSRPAIPGLVGILEDRQQMKRRIATIARYQRPTRWSALAVLALIALGLVTLTDAQVKAPTTSILPIKSLKAVTHQMTPWQSTRNTVLVAAATTTANSRAASSSADAAPGPTSSANPGSSATPSNGSARAAIQTVPPVPAESVFQIRRVVEIKPAAGTQL